MLYDNCWNYGAYSYGTFGRIEYAAGATMGSASDPVSSTDTNNNIALHGKLGFAISPGLKIYGSVARGAYLSEDVAPYLPPGGDVEDYMQTVYIGSFEWQWRYFNMMGEVFFNHYDTPLRAEGLSNQSFYLQGVYKLFPGMYIAGRYDMLLHEKVDTNFGRMTWDNNIRRYEAGIGYHFSRELLGKVVVQQTDEGLGWTRDTLLPAVQLSFAF